MKNTIRSGFGLLAAAGPTLLLGYGAMAGPPECFLDPPCAGTPEGEVCNDTDPDVTNGGCDSTPNVFSTFEISETVCGTNWATNGQRDGDWWTFSNTVLSVYDLHVRAETDTIAFIAQLSPGGVCPVIGIPDDGMAFSGDCHSEHVVAYAILLDPGDYAVVVLPGNADGSSIGDGFPCPDGTLTNNAYEMAVCKTPIPLPPHPWDLNQNCDVDFADILLVIRNWGPCPMSPPVASEGIDAPTARNLSHRGPRRARGVASTVIAGSGDTPGSGPTITGAQIMTGPVAISGDTSDNTDQFDVGPLTNPPTDCGASTAPDAWYTIEIEAATGPAAIDIDLCETSAGGSATNYDSKIFVLDAAMNPLQCSDESGCSTGPGPSRIVNLQLDPGTYELAIDGSGAASGVYEGEVRLFVPNVCFLDPPCSGPLEGEPCDTVNPDNFNGGCNSTPEAFSMAAIDQKVCGVNWGNDGTRDTDWWSFSNTVLRQYELEVRAETQTVVFLARMSAGGTCPVTGIPNGVPAFSGDCDANHILGTDYILDPGDYIMFVGTGTASGGGVFDGFPCPDGITSNNEYEVEIRNVPLPPPPCPWDLNQNNSVDFGDILQVIANWGPYCPPPCP